MTGPDPAAARDRIMWAGTIGRGRTPFDVVDGTVAAGYGQTALNAQTLGALDRDDLLRLREHCRSHDISVAVIDGVFDWLPLDPHMFKRPPCDLERVLHQAEILGAGSLGALAMTTDTSITAIAERFAYLCARVEEAGSAVTIEFTPLSAVPDLDHAHRLLTIAGHPRAGAMFDTWHFFRGTPDMDLLAALPGGVISAVQIADAALEPVGSLLEDTLHHRRHPGDGDLDLRTLLRLLDRIGALNAYGPEVLSIEQSQRSPVDAGAHAASRLDEFLSTILDT